MAAELSDDVPNTATTPSTASPPIDLTEPFMLGEWRIEPALRRACNAETVVKIDPRNLRVLQILAERRGKVVPQREIESLAWEGVIVTPDSLYQSIRQLRQALRDTKTPPKYIETISRKGYRLVADVRACASETTQAESADVRDEPSPSSVATALSSAQSNSNRWNRGRAMQIGVALSIGVGALAYGLIQLAPRQIAYSSTAIDDARRSDVSLHLSIAERSAGSDVQALRDLGKLARRQGRSREALELFERALDSQLQKSGEQNEVVVELLTELASAYFYRDDDVAARTLGLRAMTILDQLGPASSPGRIHTLSILGEVLVGSGEYDQAELLINDALRLSRVYYGKGLDTLAALGAHSFLRFAQGRLPEAEASAREALEISVSVRGVSDIRTAYWRTLVAAILIDRGKYREAETEARRALEILQGLGYEHPYVVTFEHVLAEALLKMGKLEESEALLRREFDALGKEDAVGWRIGRAASALGEVLLLKGNLSEADQYLSLAGRKLTRSKGWPIERENRQLTVRRQLMANARATAASPTGGLEILPSR